jgi:hypothetical protein
VEVAMPTVKLENGYRFYFYSRETGEPPHIHVEFGDKLAKYWLDPVALASSKRFRDHELTEVERLVFANRQAFIEAWHGYFNAER